MGLSVAKALGREMGNPLQDSCLDNPMDRDPWRGLGGVGQSVGSQRVRHDFMTEHTVHIGRAQKILLLLCIITIIIIGKTGLASDPPSVVSPGPS